ncbi:MAG: DUF4931 domain-containing protein [Paludibacter sp.]|nr:DUF4931 domain-containing protein [Paludibacter sp.]
MIELRRDPISSRWVIINDNRDFEYGSGNDNVKILDKKLCPFCYGKENMTPPALVAYDKKGNRVNGNKDWQIRVIPNNKPILAIEGSISRRAEGLYDKMNGVGAHEIIIETSSHTRDINSFGAVEFAQDIVVAQERINDLKNDSRFEYISLFKNHGQNAGETISHPHFQLVALPIIPKNIKDEMVTAQKYYEFKERCLICDIIEQEISSGARIVTESDSFIAFVPFASRYPFETWILPKEHTGDFRTVHDKKKIEEMAEICISVFRRLFKVLDNPSYNLVLKALPLKQDFLPYYHWHVEIVPKITRFTGFELGTGMYINPTIPEESAKFLREAE